MARERRRRHPAARHRSGPGIRRERPPVARSGAHTPRGKMPRELARRLIFGGPWLLRLALLGLLALFASQFFVAAARSAEPIRAVRIWPAPDYTRLTLE